MAQLLLLLSCSELNRSLVGIAGFLIHFFLGGPNNVLYFFSPDVARGSDALGMPSKRSFGPVSKVQDSPPPPRPRFVFFF